MKTRPVWSTKPPASDSGGSASGTSVSDSFDNLPLDEDDECPICMGAPAPLPPRVWAARVG